VIGGFGGSLLWEGLGLSNHFLPARIEPR